MADERFTVRFTTAADRLRELLATRPAEPTAEELQRWWTSSMNLLPLLLGDLEDVDRRDAEALAVNRRLRDELDRVKAAAVVYVVETHAMYEGSTLHWAGTSFDLAKAEADSHRGEDVTIGQWRDGVCLKVWDRASYAAGYTLRVNNEDGTWTRSDEVLEIAPPCCPSSTLPGNKHDIGCRGTGKVH